MSKQRQSIRNKIGITLIALIITIVVLLILTTVAVSSVFGEGGIINKARLAAFIAEIQAVKENVALKKMEQMMMNTNQKPKLFEENLNESTIVIKDTLKREILYAREEWPEGKGPDDYQVEDFESIIDDYGNIAGIYIIDEETGNGKANTYLYDEQTDTVFKAPQTKIGKKIYHSYECAQNQNGGTDTGEGAGGTGSSTEGVITKEARAVAVENEVYYGPNLKGFTRADTYVVYYSENFNETKEIPAQEYIDKGEPYQIEDGGKMYTLHNYGKKIWANIKTTGNGLEAWWVWIPRYAYLIDSENKKMNIIYINLQNKPLNTQKDGAELPEGYIVHPAFTVDGKELKGIWMSKYEPSYKHIPEAKPSNNVLPPDMRGFDEDYTYIELYNSSKGTFTDTPLKGANLNNINKNKEWYDYENKIWANIKTTANGLEAWWVWIPRYAYKIRSEANKKEMDVIFVDMNNQPLDTEQFPDGLPEGYIVHSAFTVDGKDLSGIWMSKYEPSYTRIQEVTPSNNVLPPDMRGFDEENTFIELYNNGTFTDTPLKGADLNSINQNKEWYDYENKIWANIKTTANDQEAWWVWIPRYAYKINDKANVHEMEVIFVDTNNQPLDKEQFPDGLPEGYIVHPAFTVDGKELSGIWMSKYEPSEKK